MSAAEKERIEATIGRPLPRVMFEIAGAPCPLLSGTKCSVYGLRPTVCRLWGVAESMPCPHGCTPEGGRLLTDQEVLELMLRALEVGGARYGDTERARKMLHQLPEMRPLIARVLRGDHAAAAEMAALARKRFPRGVPPEDL